jgi:hypothetical protein
VDLEKELQKCAKAVFLGIENNLDGFRMAVMMAVGGIPHLARSRPAACE